MPDAVELHRDMNEMADRNTPLLAICIPTRNRREVLEECLASVLPQAEALGVGVCVSDNGSTDGTWQLLETLQRQYPWMQTVRHTRDIGFQDNLTSAVLTAHAQYVWPIGDKWVLLPGALEFVVVELLRLHPDAIIVNSQIQVALTSNRTYSSPQPCLIELGWYVTNLAVTVLPRQAFVSVLQAQPVNQVFPHVVALFCYLASLPTNRVLFYSQVPIQIGKIAIDNGVMSSWAGNTLTTFGRSWYGAVMSLPALYSTKDKLQAVKSISEHTGLFGLGNLMRLRAEGELTFQQLNVDRVPLQAVVAVPWWSAVIISTLPRWMLRPVLYVHPLRMLRALRSRLRLSRGQQAHRSAP